MGTVMERTKYLDPTNDVAFKKVFMEPNRLRDFLNAILRRPAGAQIETIEFLSQDLVPNVGQGKRGMFDIKCKDEAGNRFIIEMQNENKPYFLNRVQFYGMHTYVSQLEIKKPHKELLPVVVIVVIKEILFPDEEIECINYHQTVERKTNKHHLNALSYVFVELKKFKKTAKELKSIEDYWLYFLTHSPEITSPPASLEDKWILNAYDTITQFNWNSDEYDAYLRARLSLEAEDLAVSEAEMKGRAEERAARNIEIAKKMLVKGKDIKEIAEFTELSEEEIKKLQS